MLSSTFRTELKQNIRLAVPVSLGQLGHISTHLADNIMVGQLGHVPLAAASFAHSIFAFFLLFEVGLSMGITPIAGKLYGENNTRGLSRLFQWGALFMLLMALLVAGLMMAVIPLFPYLNQPTDVVALAIPYYKLVAISMVPNIVFMHSKSFIDGLGNTRPGMVISLIFNLLNIILNYIFIYGKLGMPAYGLNGAAYATIIAKTLMSVAVLLYMRHAAWLAHYMQGMKWPVPWDTLRQIAKVSFPIGIQFSFEIGIFSVGSIMAGWFGSKPLAAHQIALSISSMTYVLASGIAAAGTIRISHFYGQRQFHQMKTASRAAYLLVLLFMFTMAIGIVLLRAPIARLFISEPDVVAIAGGLFLIMAFYQLFDGLQVVAIGALRGLQEVRLPTAIVLFAYWGIGIPTGYLLSRFTALDVQGVWFGYMAGLGMAALWLSVWFERTRKKRMYKHTQGLQQRL